MMKNQRPLFIMLAVLLIFVIVHFFGWQALLLLVFIGMLLFALIGHTYLSAKQERSKLVPVYEPPSAQQAVPLTLPTPSEEPRTTTYDQGYQPQMVSWSPFIGITRSTGQSEQPKQDNVNDYYEQPQAQYPQEMPPPIA